MLHLIFGILLLLGCLAAFLFKIVADRKTNTEAIVKDSRCEIEKDGKEFKSISVIHTLIIEEEDKTTEIVTDLLPVRETKGMKVRVNLNRENYEIEKNRNADVVPVVVAMAVSGIACILQYFIFLECNVSNTGKSFLEGISTEAVLSFFMILLAAEIIADCFMIISPLVVRVTGTAEGLLIGSNKNKAEEIYSLWYGEHRQYAKRKNGITAFVHEKEETMYFHTKKGTVIKKADILWKVCFAMALVLATLLLNIL